jgi:hypothetical protein
MRHLSAQARVEAAVAAATAVLCVLTIAWPDWVEGITGLDPDHGNGWFEWALVVVLALISLGCALRTRRALRGTPVLDHKR